MHFVRKDIFPRPGGLVNRLPFRGELVLDEERITLLELRIRLGSLLGKRPHPNTIHRAVKQGFPCEPHPLVPGRRVYPWAKCLAWIQSQQAKPVLPLRVRQVLANQKR